jgi:hypothetical protein
LENTSLRGFPGSAPFPRPPRLGAAGPARLVPLFALLAAPFCVPVQVQALAIDGSSALDQFRDAYRLIRERYVTPPGDFKLIDGAIKGLVKGLDSHSDYLDGQGLHGSSALDQFRDAYQLIRERSVTPPDDFKLMDGAIKGLVKGLDPHSEYLDAQGFRTLQERLLARPRKGTPGERPPVSPPNSVAGSLAAHVGSDTVHPRSARPQVRFYPEEC